MDSLTQLWPAVQFTPTEARLLEYLLSVGDRPVPREELLQQVWGYSPATKTRTVQTTVQRVRLKIEPDPSRPQYLLSLRGRGYRLQPPGARAVATSVATTREEVERRVVEWLGPDQDWVTVVSPRERTTNVPPAPDPFVGRQTEVRALHHLLADGVRLITLHGAAGLGKTRLSQEVARGVGDAYPGGVWFCALEDTTRADDALSLVASTLGLVIAPQDERPLLDQLIQLLSARGATLIVLDNMEQLEEDATDAVRRLHDGADALRLLVTSRRRLGLAAEHVHDVLALDGAEAGELLRCRAQSAGVPRPVLADEEDLSRVATLLEGMPLALEMAASSLRLMSLPELGARLGRGLGGLTLRRAGASERQTTLRGAIAWSWDLLDDGERSALIQMAVFRGGASLALAEQVVRTDGDTLEVLASLLDKSMLRPAHHLGHGRLALFESVREFVLEQADVGLCGARGRHADWAVHYAADGAARSRTDASAVPDLADHVDNLVQALRWLIASRSERAIDLVEALFPLYRARFVPHDYPDLLRQVRAHVSPSARGAARLNALFAWVLAVTGQSEAAYVEAQSGLDKVRASDALWGELMAALTLVSIPLRRFESALQPALDAVAQAKTHGWVVERIRLLDAVCSTLRMMRRADEGLRYSQEALQLATQHGLLGLAGMLHTNVGGTLSDLGRTDEALEQMERARELVRRFDDQSGLQTVRTNLALLYVRAGRVAEADALFGEAIAFEQRFGGRGLSWVAKINAGFTALLAGAYPRAHGLLMQALAVLPPNSAWEHRTCAYLVVARAGMSDLTEAQAMLERLQQQAGETPSHDEQRELALYAAHLQVARAQQADAPADAPVLEAVFALLAGEGLDQEPLSTAATLLRSALSHAGYERL